MSKSRSGIMPFMVGVADFIFSNAWSNRLPLTVCTKSVPEALAKKNTFCLQRWSPILERDL